MPLHLPPTATSTEVSRRSFLRGTAGLLISPLFLGRGRAAETAPPSWAFLADTHIAENTADVNQGQNMAENLAKVAADVLASGARPAVVNGDMARTEGTPGDYASFLKLVEPLRARMPVHLTLGNHDDRTRFLGAMAKAGIAVPKGPVDERYVSAIEVDGHRWLFLDSLDKPNVTPGVLGKAQIAWVERELEAHPDPATLIFIHHNVEKGAKEGLVEYEDFMRVLRPARQVKAVFFGHTHVWRRWTDAGIHMVNLPAVSYAFRAGEPLGWVRASPRDGGLNLELRSLLPHADHLRKIELEWRPEKVRAGRV